MTATASRVISQGSLTPSLPSTMTGGPVWIGMSAQCRSHTGHSPSFRIALLCWGRGLARLFQVGTAHSLGQIFPKRS